MKPVSLLREAQARASKALRGQTKSKPWGKQYGLQGGATGIRGGKRVINPFGVSCMFVLISGLAELRKTWVNMLEVLGKLSLMT